MSSQLEQEVQEIQLLQKDMKKLFDGKQKLIEQQQECQLVKNEMDILESNAVVYKLIGNVQTKLTVAEAKQNVNKRIEFISGETKKIEIVMKDNENKQITKRSKIMQIQEETQKQQEAK